MKIQYVLENGVVYYPPDTLKQRLVEEVFDIRLEKGVIRFEPSSISKVKAKIETTPHGPAVEIHTETRESGEEEIKKYLQAHPDFRGCFVNVFVHPNPLFVSGGHEYAVLYTQE